SANWTFHEVISENATDPRIIVDENDNPKIVYWNFYSSLKFAHCDMISECNETSDWAIYTITGLTHTANAEIAVDSNGDLHLAFSRGDGSQADMYYGSCSSASGCDAAEDWTLVNIHDVPAS